MSFDEITLLNRLKKVLKNAPAANNIPAEFVNINGKNLVEYRVCDEKYMYLSDPNGKEYWLTPKAYYRADKSKSFVDRIDTYTILDGINHFDQMLYYANIRKSSGMKETYSLDSSANEELGVEKLDYTGYTIKNLPWLNFPKFYKYNVKDVILLVLLEKKNLDFDMVQRHSEITNTRKEKVFKKTVSLKNFVSKFALEEGFVMNNNKNTVYGNDNQLFETQYLVDIKDKDIVEHDIDYRKSFDKKENFGAYVGDPLLNKPCGILDSSGKPSKYVFENVFDEDFSSLYPSIIMAYSLSPNGQVGKFFFLDDDIKNKLISQYDYDGLFLLSKNEEGSIEENKTDLGPTLVDSLISHNWSRIGEKFFDLPSTEEMITDLKSKKKKA
jgi:DNA polymerase elongation subunit (family B)